MFFWLEWLFIFLLRVWLRGKCNGGQVQETKRQEMLSLTLSLKALRVKLSLSSEERMWGLLSVARGSLITKSHWTGMVSNQASLSLPAAQLAPHPTLALPGPCFLLTELLKALPIHGPFTHAVSLHLTSSLPATSRHSLLLLPDTSLYLFLAMGALQCQLLPASRVPGLLQPLVLTFSQDGCCVSSPPAGGASWAGTCAAHRFPIPSSRHMARPTRSARADWLETWINNLPTSDHNLYCYSSRALSRLPLESGTPLGFQM